MWRSARGDFYSSFEPSQCQVMEHAKLLERAVNAFQDLELLHNKYYAVDGIMAQVAEVIASE